MQSKQPGAQHAQNSGDDRGLQEKPPCTLPTRHHIQHCDCSKDIQVPRIHHLSGPELVPHIDSVKKKPNKGYTSFASWGSLTFHRSCWNSSTLLLLSLSCALGLAQLHNQTSEDYREWFGLLNRLLVPPLPTLQKLYTSRVRKRAQKITLDPSHQSHPLFELFQSGRHYRALITRTARHKNSFFPRQSTLWTVKCPSPTPLCNKNVQ